MANRKGRVPLPEQSIGVFLERVDPPSMKDMKRTAYTVFAAVGGDEEQCALLLRMILGPTSGYSTARFGGAGPRRPPGPKPGQITASSSVVRHWARAEGYGVPERGGVASAVFEAYKRATGGDSGT